MEGLDDDHLAAAARAATEGRSRLSVGVGVSGRAFGRDFGRGEQVSSALDVVCSKRAGEQAVMSDAVESARQHVQEKAADVASG